MMKDMGHGARIDADRILMKTNVFNIPERLKAVDRGYFVCFNTKNGKYELHHEACYPAPQLVFDELDGSAVELTMKTRGKSASSITKEVKAHNEKLDAKKEAERKERNKIMTKEINRYMDTHPSDETVGGVTYESFAGGAK